MAFPGPALGYTSYDGSVLSLYPWEGRHVALLTSSSALNPQAMASLVDAIDRAFEVYQYLTGREPSLFRQYNGLATIAQVPTTFGTNGGALGWLGSTGIELSQAVWTRLYSGVTNLGAFDQAVFYELGRNFWFYGDQLGAVDPFVTGFAIVNRFISMAEAGLPGAPFNDGPALSEVSKSILEDLASTYLSGSSYTLGNTIVAGTGVPSPNGWGAADLAASLLYQVYEDFGLAAYRSFYVSLDSLPTATSSTAAIQNFINAANLATGIDYSFLNKPAGVSYITGGRSADTLSARPDGSPVFGFCGSDTLIGTGAADLLFGDAGDDSLFGNAGNDSLVGGAGADLLQGGAGNDRLFGGEDGDTLSGGAGTDVLDGLGGYDTYVDTIAGLTGDTIASFQPGDRIILSDASPASFSFMLVGSTLTFAGGSITFGSSIAGKLVASAAIGGGVQIALDAVVAGPKVDFSGDGRSDILWRDTSGTITNWLGQANGGFAGNNANLFTNVDPSWTLARTGDFNGDGRADVLWRHTSGLVTDWLGQANGGFVPNNANLFTSVDVSWKIVGTGDFNGDGRDDVLFRHSSGLLTDWLGQANGALNPNNANLFVNVDSSWAVVATGDFNGDGRDDVLFRHSSGLLTDWLGQANGGLSPNANLFTSVDPSWKVIGAGDFNGDGRDDILWRHSSGALTNWLGQANGGFVANNANALSQSDNSWHVVGIGDYNGDGRDDLAWRHDSGAFSEWLGQATGGFASNHGIAANQVATSWQVQSPDVLFL